MWRRTVLVLNLLAVINRTSTQLSSNGTDTEVQAPKRCCPCPPETEPSLGSAPEAWEPGTGAGVNLAAPGAPASAADDCPCRPRDADSEGASSLFASNAVRAAGNVVRSDPAEEVKPLLQPEVDLASSVLETLREATDEDYRDALERDAARAATFDAEDTDANPQEAKVVTIIVSPEDMADDPISEASHVQATRCIDSLLGSPRASFNRPPVHQKGLEEILNLPLPGGLLHRQRDSNLAASNVHESVVKADRNMNKLLSGLKLRAEPGLLNLDPHKISEDINKILSGQTFMSSDNSRRKSAQPTAVVTDAMTNMINNENTDDGDDVSSVETDNIDKQSVVDEDVIELDKSNLDTDPSPSSINGLFSKATRNEDRNLQKEDSFPKLKYPKLAKKPQNLFPLKNLFKLKDVELVPLDLHRHIPKSKVNIPSMKIEPIQTNKASENALNLVKLPKLSDLFREPSKITIEKGVSKEATDEVVDNGNIETSANIQTIPRKTTFKTEILDAIPSTSEIKPVTLSKDNCISPKPNSNNLSDIETRGDESSFENLNADSDTEQLIDSKEEDNLNISDDNTLQGLDPQEISENTRDSELDATETFDIIDEDQGLDSSEVIIISEEENDDFDSTAIDLIELNNLEERSNHPLKSLESIRKSVVEKLNALEISNRKALDNIKHSVEEIPKNSSSGEERMELDTEKNESLTPSDSMKDEFKEVGTSTEEVTFQDLQNMSDSILSASEKQEKAVSPKDIEQEQHDNRDSQSIGSIEEDFESEEISEDEIDSVLGIDETKRSQSKVPIPEAERNPDNSNDRNSFVDEKGVNLCPSDLIETPSSKATETKSSDGNGNIDNDLTTLASEPVVHSILRPNSKSLIEHLGDIESKLRQNIIVQPTSLINTDDLNIFRTPTLSIPDISELHANIPTLDEIRMRVSEILGGLARTAGDDEDSSEFDSDDFASNHNPVISSGVGSSAPNSLMSSLKPLEDINLNIIQLKPLPLLPGLHPLKSEFPGWNLNTYKAKLSVPKSLDFKPLKLASTLGSDGGLVGATLSVGPERKVKAGKAKQKTKVNSNYVSSAQNSPTLADITASIQNNARNLLNIPEMGRGQTLQASNVVQSFAENMKSHTENTMRNIHQTLNPSPLDTFHADLRKNANNLLNSGRSALGSLHTAAPINNALDSLRAQTENTLKHVHQTLSSPKITDLSSTIHRNAENLLRPPTHHNNKILKNKLQSSGSIDAALDSLKAQSENTYRNIQQTLNTSPLEDLSKSIHKTANHVLKSAPRITSGNNILRATPQTIPQISGVVDNLRHRTDSALHNIQQTLHRPALSDISTSIHKSTQHNYKSPELLRNSLPSTSLDRVVDNLKAHTQSTMRNIQNSLTTPALGDLSAIVPTHSQNLLKSPVVMAGREAFDQILQASPPVIDLKPHAEKAVKDLQKTIKATLRNSPIKDLQPLTDPNQVLQMISDHHEDVNDKLFAIRTDFADRLESMHNDVMDPQRLRSILSPPINRNFELFAIPLPNSRMSSPNPRTQTRPVLKSKQPSFDNQRKESKKSTVPKAYKSISGTPKLGEMRTTTGKERGLPKPLKLPTAASAPVPAKIKRPSKPPVPKKPVFLKNLLNDFFDPLPPGPEPRKTYQSTTTRRPFVPKRKTETKVTFGSTTRRPVLSPVSKRPPFVPISTTPRPKVSDINRFKPKPLVRQPTPWSPAGSALSPIRVPDHPTSNREAPIAQPPKPKLAKPVNSKLGTLPRLGSLSSRHNPQPLVKPKLSKAKFEISPKAQGRSSIPDTNLLSVPRTPPSLLNKLTEALKGKQTKVNLGSPLQRANDGMEMASAASDSIGSVVAIENPMQENVAYKCKMTCVKLD